MSDKFDAFRVATLTNLAGLAKVLGMLPIPIEVRVGLEQVDETIGDLLRARTLLAEEPMSEVLHAAVNTAILDWLSGLTLGTVADGDEENAVWLYTAAMISMRRCQQEVGFALDILDGNIIIED